MKHFTLIFGLFFTLAAQSAFGQSVEEWNVEKGSARRAATLERVESETLSYGFSCWKKTWVFFFNLQSPEGGICADHAACEKDVAEVNLTFKIDGAPERTDVFNLFENYYFQEMPLALPDLKAILDAKHFELALDERLKKIWNRETLAFSTDGLEEAVASHKKEFACPLRILPPMPRARPEDAILAKRIAPPPTAAKKAYKLAAKKMATTKASKIKLGKNKPVKGKAAQVKGRAAPHKGKAPNVRAHQKRR